MAVSCRFFANRYGKFLWRMVAPWCFMAEITVLDHWDVTNNFVRSKRYYINKNW